MRNIRYQDLLKQSLGLGERENISLVGAGGKTSLMYLLARSLSASGHRVITTTTTKILEPGPDETPCLSLGEAHESVLEKVDVNRHVTVASQRLTDGKLQGIPSRQVDKLWESGRVDYLIVEADGAARRPLKAPAPHEPVIPASTGLVVALVGADGFDARLSEETVFRSQIFSRLTGLTQGERVTYQAISLMLTHRDGLTRGAPSSARIVPFVNKVDLDEGLRKGREFARVILDSSKPSIDRVILGQVQLEPPILEVIYR